MRLEKIGRNGNIRREAKGGGREGTDDGMEGAAERGAVAVQH